MSNLVNSYAKQEWKKGDKLYASQLVKISQTLDDVENALVDEVTPKVEANIQAIEELRTQFAELSETVGGSADAILAQVDEKLVALEKKILGTDGADIAEYLDTLKEIGDFLVNDENGLKTLIETNAADIADIHTDISTLQTASGEVDGKIETAVESAKTEVKAYADEKVATLSETLTEKVDGVDGKVDTLSEKVDGVDSKVVTLEEKETVSEGKVSVLEGKVSTLETKTDAIEESVEAIDASVDSKISEAKTEVKAYADENDATAVSTAKAYADGKAEEVTTEVKAYTDQALETAKAFATEEASGAKAYADEKVAELGTAVEDGDNVVKAFAIEELAKKVDAEEGKSLVNDADVQKWDALADEAVRFTAVPSQDLPNRKAIVLENHDLLLGRATANGEHHGDTFNLAMVSKWDVADFGSNKLHMNLNSKDGVVTINDNDVVATEEVVDTKINESANATSNAISALSERVVELEKDPITKTAVEEKIEAAKTALKDELVDGASEAIDTFKEVAEYIEEHAGVETSLIAKIEEGDSALSAQIGAVDEKADGVAESVATVSGRVDTLSDRVDAVETGISDANALIAQNDSKVREDFATALEEVGAAIDAKASKDELATEVATINTAIDAKASKEELSAEVATINTALDAKASTAEVEEALAVKASKEELNAEVANINTAISAKASAEDLASAVSELNTKVDGKASTADVDALTSNVETISTALETKASADALANAVSELTTEIAKKEDIDPKIVRMSEFTHTDSEGQTATRNTIQLNNFDSISGLDTEGNGHSLLMLSRWNVADFGSKEVQANINTLSYEIGDNSYAVLTINDTNFVVTDKNLGVLLHGSENLSVTPSVNPENGMVSYTLSSSVYDDTELQAKVAEQEATIVDQSQTIVEQGIVIDQLQSTVRDLVASVATLKARVAYMESQSGSAMTQTVTEGDGVTAVTLGAQVSEGAKGVTLTADDDASSVTVLEATVSNKNLSVTAKDKE